MVANFFAYFKPTECLNSSAILFLICCPNHLREKVKQELKNEGITPHDTTCRRIMIPGQDKAFVFVSGGVRPVRTEDMEDFYLRLVSKGLTWFCPTKNLGRTFWFGLHHPRRMCINCIGPVIRPLTFSNTYRTLNIVAPFVQLTVSIFFYDVSTSFQLKKKEAFHIQKEQPSLNQQLHHVNLRLSF